MESVAFAGPQPVTTDPNLQVVHANATVASNGSFTTEATFGASPVLLVINITGTPTGGTPTLQFSVQEVDPVDLVTPVGSAINSNTFSAAGYQVVTLASASSCAFKVSWTVGGSTPSFTGVNVSMSAKSGAAGSSSNASVGTNGATAPTSSTQIAGIDHSTGLLTPVAVCEDGHVAIAGSDMLGYAGEVVAWTSHGHKSPAVDAAGASYIRGQVMTDEGSFVDDFLGSGLTTALTGTLDFTSGSDQVVGTGTAFLSELNYYSVIKKTADGETLWVGVSSVEDDTHLTLASNYGGTTQSGQTAVKSIWKTLTGASGGAAIAVSASNLVLTSGTGSGVKTGFWTIRDYIPFLGTFKLAASGRIANQKAFIGFFDDITSPQISAGFLFDGTTNTTIKCVSSNSSAAAGTQTTSVTIPGGINSTAQVTYQIVPWQGQVSFLINGYQVAVHNQHVIPPYSVVGFGGYIVNEAVVGSNTLTIDSVILESIDRFDARVYSPVADHMQVMANGRTTTGLAVPLQVSTAGIQVVSASGNFTVAQGTAANLKAQVVGISAALADAASNTQLVVPGSCFQFGYNGTTWDRLRSSGSNADGEAVDTVGVLDTKGLTYIFNGTTWDRLRAGDNDADGDAVGSTGILMAEAYGRMFNGTTWDRVRGTIANGLQVDVTRVQGNVTVVQGNAGTAAQGWFARLTDGSNNVAVKAPSTAAVAADPALVVAISPNNPLAIGGSTTPSDAFSNPTTAMLSASFGMGWNGTTWDRLKSSTANGLQVDVTRVQGSVAVTGTFWQTTQPVSGTVTSNQGTANTIANAWPVKPTDGTNSMPMGDAAARALFVKSQPAVATTSAVTQVASSATSVTLKATNANRLGLMIFNDSTSVLYVKFGATASTTSYTVKMTAGQYYEAPFGYTGVVDGIWASANGNAYITEVTA